MLSERARPLANDTPTNKEPIKPGPLVKAIALSCSFSTPALFKASCTTGTIFCWWAREASSGTTPPYDSCTAWLATTFESNTPLRMTAAEVSSQDDSMPKMIVSISLYLIYINKSGFQVRFRSSRRCVPIGRTGVRLRSRLSSRLPRPQTLRGFPC